MKPIKGRRPIEKPERYTKRSIFAFIIICSSLIAVLILNPVSKNYVYTHTLNQWIRILLGNP